MKTHIATKGNGVNVNKTHNAKGPTGNVTLGRYHWEGAQHVLAKVPTPNYREGPPTSTWKGAAFLGLSIYSSS